MKRTSLIIINVLLLLILGVLTIAQSNPLIPPGIDQLLGPYQIITCFESDGGPDIYRQGRNRITYYEFNSTTNTSRIRQINNTDFCLNGRLAEGLCGSWLDQNLGTTIHASLAYLPTFYCNASNNATTQFSCVNGACVPS